MPKSAGAASAVTCVRAITKRIKIVSPGMSLRLELVS